MKKATYTLLLISFLSLNSLFSFGQSVQSNFTTNDTIGCIPLTTAFNNNSSGATSYLWTFGNGNTSTLQSPVNTYSNPGSYTVKLIAYGYDGSSDTTTFFNHISVIDTPNISFSFINDTVCPEVDSVAFTNNTSLANSYLWDFGDGNISNAQNPYHIYNQPGANYVTLIAYNSLGCTSNKTHPIPIEIHSKPNGLISSDLTLVCDTTSSVTFNANSASSVNTVWNFGDGITSSGLTASHTYATEGVYPVSAIITDINGCQNTINKFDNIVVKQSLTPVITYSDSIGCSPLSITLENITENTQVTNWTIGGLPFSGQNIIHTFTDTGAHDILVTVLDSIGCSTDNSFNNLISVHSPPPLSFDISDSIGCAPLQVFLTNVGDTLLNYNWSFSDGQIFNQYSPATLNFNEAQSINLNVTISDPISGCQSNEAFINLVNIHSAASSVSISDLTGCEPLSVSFTEDENDIVQWLWNFGDGTISSNTNPTHTYDSAGVYTLELITTNNIGCVDTVTFEDTITVISPQYNYTIPDTIFTCNSIVSSFDGTYLGKESWLWDFGDGTTSTNPIETHTYYVPGHYEVSLTTYDQNGCQFTIEDYNNYSIANNSFGFDYGLSCQDNLFSFTDTSLYGTEWLWDFGDGTIDSVQNPIHQYSLPGLYLVQFTVSSGGCDQTVNSIVSSAFCLPAESVLSTAADPNQGPADSTILIINTGSDSLNYHCAPYTINVSSPFNNTISILWDFGDGTTSTELTPTHTYNSAGVYDLNITVTTNDSIYHIVSPEYLWLDAGDSDYNYNQVNICEGGALVYFNTDSLLSQSYLWSFGDGNQSADFFPTHVYGNPGIYTSSLQTTNDNGCTSTIVKPIAANLSNPIFDYPSVLCLNETANFSSNINDYADYTWYFGDGQSQSGQFVSHIYQNSGTFSVTISFIDSLGCSESVTLPTFIEVNNPIAEFTILDTVGCDNLDVSFNNLSQHSSNWIWDFDNEITSTDENPNISFNYPGIYDISLISFLGACSDTATIPFGVTVHESVPAEFTYTKQSSCYPVTLSFQNNSSSINSFYWDFGDGFTDTTANPFHTFYLDYATSITLNIVDSNNCNSAISYLGEVPYKSSFEIASLSGCVPVYASFHNTSDSAVSWLWDFGNGDISTLSNPNYVYADTGSYQVSLISTSNEGCTDTVTANELITVEHILADFSTTDSASCAPMVNSFTNLSVNANNWDWDFGDGSFSNIQNPSHVYAEPGLYSVILTAGRDSSCFDSIIKSDVVIVLGPIANYTLSDSTGCDSLNLVYTNLSSQYSQAEWFFGDGSFSSDSDADHLFNDTGTFVGTLVVYDENGCSNYKAIDTIKIHSSPVISYAPIISEGCKPFEVSFINTTFNTSNCLWDFGYGMNSALDSSSYTYNVANKYYASLWVESKDGCVVSEDSIEINVHAAPSVQFITDTSQHCFPATLEFVNMSADTINVEYSWDFYNGTYSSEISPSITFPNPGQFDVKLSATDQFNCTSELIKQNYIKLFDSIPPTPNLVYAASVRESGGVIVSWEKSTENDFHSYNIYRSSFLDSSYRRIDSLLNKDSTISIQPNLQTDDQYYNYLIQPIDQCGNKVSLEKITEYRTIHLTAESIDENIVQLNWNHYKGSQPETYSIYRRYKETVEKIGEVDSTTNLFIDNAFKCNSTYSYTVVAENLGRTSYLSQSNTVTIEVQNTAILNQTIDIVRSTVIENEFVLTEWSEPSAYPEKITGFTLLRSDKPDSGFEPIAELPPFVTQYSDYQTDVMSQSYYYKINVENICNQNLSTNISTSILLQYQSDGNNVIINWNEYKGWGQNVEKYIIEKQINDNEWEIIKEVPGTETKATDVIID